MKQRIYIPLLIVFVFSQFAAFAQPRGPEHKRLMKKLGLTEDQKDKISDLRAKHQKTMIDLKADLEKLHIEKRSIVEKGNIDRKSFLDLEDKLIAASAKLRKEQATFKMDVYSLFTTEQKAKVSNFARKFFEDKGPKMMKRGKGMRFGAGFRNECQSEKSCIHDDEDDDAPKGEREPHRK